MKQEFKNKNTSINNKEDNKEYVKPLIKGQCAYYRKCSGCQLQNMDYKTQLKFKQSLVERHIGKIKKPKEIIGMEDPVNYRNKASCAFSTDIYGKPIHGVFQSKTKHVVKVKNCMIQNKESNKIISTVAKLVDSFKLEPYNSMKEKGFFRHVLIRNSLTTGEVMVVLVTKSVVFPSSGAFAKALLEKHSNITTIIHCVNEGDIDMLTGKEYKVLYGKGYIEDKLLDLTFKLSAQSFYQVNPIQTQKLYSKAIELANITKDDIVLDAYCGTGTIGLLAANKAKAVIGIELNKEAVYDAKTNAKTNGIKNANFFCGDAGKIIKDIVSDGIELDVVLMDPPRTGSDPKFLNVLCGAKPKKIVYISCNPETLARDMKLLVESGYKAEELQPVDMFPYTNHVETVCLLSKIK